MRLTLCVGLVGCGFHGTEVHSDAIAFDALSPDAAPVVLPATGCAPLAATRFSIVVSSASALTAAVATVPAGGVIGIDDGTYDLSTGVTIATPGLTLRSTSGDPTKVILRGGAAATITIAASNVTLADFTIHEPTTTAIVVVGGATEDTTGTQLYDLTLANPGGPALRIQPANASIAGPFADNGTLACSRILDLPTGPSHCVGGTIGVVGTAARGWLLRDNDIEGAVCPTAFARAILFFDGSRDTQVVRNHITGSNMNIAFGLGPGIPRVYTDPPPVSCAGNIPDHRGGLICDNVIDGLVVPSFPGTSDFDTGIGLWGACDAWVMHNTVASPVGAETFHDIEYRFAGTYVHLVNNLTEQLPAAREGSPVNDAAFATSDATYASLADFVNSMAGDFHLATTAPELPGASIAATGLCGSDADGKPRPGAPMVGAYER